jgi:hypothetical protein
MNNENEEEKKTPNAIANGKFVSPEVEHGAAGLTDIGCGNKSTFEHSYRGLRLRNVYRMGLKEKAEGQPRCQK